MEINQECCEKCRKAVKIIEEKGDKAPFKNREKSCKYVDKTSE